jgi:serine/threonine protein kinase
MPAPATGPELVELVEKSGLYAADELNAKLAELTNVPDKPVNLAAAMVKMGVITKFQAKLLLAGKYRGFRIGPYVLKDMIGQGGMGAVYEAKHTTLDRKVAVKVLTPGKDDDQQLAIERFLREARAAAALDHPNIVRLHDVGQFGNTHYLVMEYVDGETLEQIVEKKGPLPCQKAVEYICQAAAGLQSAHEKGFIHRDIKPSNLILTKDGTIKLLDMGLARSSDERDKLTGKIDMNTIVGTADFISPEQAVNDPGIDIRSDIYSLGATFFMLVTGGSPFKGNTAQKLVQHQVKDAPSLTRMDKTLPKELADVVAKMMAKKKEHRYRTPADVIAAFTPWLPNSGKVVAGLTMTHAGRSDRDTMDTIVASSTKRITKTILRATENPRSKAIVLAGAAAGILAVGSGLGYWIFGGTTTTQAKQTVTVPPPNDPPLARGSNPNPAPPRTQPIAAKVPAANFAAKSPGAVFHFRPHELPVGSFQLEGLNVVSGSKPPLPTFVNPHCWKPESKGDWRVESLDVIRAISFGSRNEPATAQLRFDFEHDVGAELTPGKEYEFRCTYRTSGGATGQMSIVTPDHKYLKGFPLPDAPKWTTESFKFTRGEVPLSCNFDSKNATDAGFLSIAKFEVIDLEAAKSAKPFYAATFDSAVPGRKLVDKPGRQTSAFSEFRLHETVRLNHHNGEASAEYAVVREGGETYLEMKLLGGSLGAQCHFDFDVADPLPADTPGIVRITYRFDGAGAGAVAIEENAKPYQKYFVTPLPATGPGWKTVEFPFVRPETKNRLSIIVNNGTRKSASDRATVRIKAVEVFVEGKSNATASAVASDPPSANLGPVRYELPIAGTAPFDLVVEKSQPTMGSPPNWPGVLLHAWKEGSVGQFRFRDKGDGLALSLTNLNDTTSAQLLVPLEYGMGIALAAGQTYTVVVEYKTVNDGAGHVLLQSENYAVVLNATLPATNGQWARKEISFARTEGKPIRLAVNATGVGEGNDLVIKSLKVCGK